MNIITCITQKRGIGMKGDLPWSLKKDMMFFKEKTLKSNVIMGYKTWESLKNKNLTQRFCIVITNKKNLHESRDTIFTTINNIENILTKAPYKSTFIIGGETIYNHFINHNLVNKIYITQIIKTPIDIECDTFFPRIPSCFQITHVSGKYAESQFFFRFLTLEKTTIPCLESPYLQLGDFILKNGNTRNDRTNIGTKSIFGYQMRFDISKQVPLFTTKRIPWKTCIEELLWFLRGETDATILQKKGIKIWDGNTSREFLDKMGFYDVPEGELRLGYGHQIRRFGDKKVDQLAYIENLLKTDPFSRRIMWNLWNASDLDKMVLTPCHNQVQFYVEEDENKVKKLYCHLYIRSSDYFLGLPFNIFSYTVLTYILAKRTDMVPQELIVTTGDTHIYLNHVNQVKEQLTRQVTAHPVLILDESVSSKNYNDIKIDDFELIFYHPMASIKGEMAI
jgi:thymidylate synthase